MEKRETGRPVIDERRSRIEEWLYEQVAAVQADFDNHLNSRYLPGIQQSARTLHNAVEQLMDYVMKDIEPSELPPNLQKF
jgi:hypothetical protein